MKEEDLELQPYIDRIGGVVKYLDPKAGIERYGDCLIVKRNAMSEVKMVFDYNGLSCEPREVTLVGLLGIIIGRIFIKEDWMNDMAENAYNTYYSNNGFEKETAEFRRNYDKYYILGPGARRGLAIFQWMFMFFFIIFILSGFKKTATMPLLMPLVCGGIFLLCWTLRHLQRKVG